MKHKTLHTVLQDKYCLLSAWFDCVVDTWVRVYVCCLMCRLLCCKICFFSLCLFPSNTIHVHTYNEREREKEKERKRQRQTETERKKKPRVVCVCLCLCKPLKLRGVFFPLHFIGKKKNNGKEETCCAVKSVDERECRERTCACACVRVRVRVCASKDWQEMMTSSDTKKQVSLCV